MGRLSYVEHALVFGAGKPFLVALLFVDRQRKQVTAEIVSAADDAVEFRNDDGSFTIPLSEIERAKILY